MRGLRAPQDEEQPGLPLHYLFNAIPVAGAR